MNMPLLNQASTRSVLVAGRYSTPVVMLPITQFDSTNDRRVIEKIRNQPKYNNPVYKCRSEFNTDVVRMAAFLGSFCQSNPISCLFRVAQEIHSNFDGMAAPEVRDWIRQLSSLHPLLDARLRTLSYWNTPYSENVGATTLLHDAGLESIDVKQWTKAPVLLSNVVSNGGNDSVPTYLRETTRHKLDSNIVRLIQGANYAASIYASRNLVWEAMSATEENTGKESVQVRPIGAAQSHGASLNSDWYYNEYHLSPSRTKCLDAVKNELNKQGNVSSLINHLTPLRDRNQSQDVLARFDNELGIEETFPRTKGYAPIDVDNTGQPIYKTPSNINDTVLLPVDSQITK